MKNKKACDPFCFQKSILITNVILNLLVSKPVKTMHFSASRFSF